MLELFQLSAGSFFIFASFGQITERNWALKTKTGASFLLKITKNRHAFLHQLTQRHVMRLIWTEIFDLDFVIQDWLDGILLVRNELVRENHLGHVIIEAADLEREKKKEKVFR